MNFAAMGEVSNVEYSKQRRRRLTAFITARSILSQAIIIAMNLCVLTSSSEDKSISVLIWSAVLIAVVIVGFVAIAAVKRRLHDDGEARNIRPLGFTLSDLRHLHKTGQMSDEEFARAKEKIIGAATKGTEAKTAGPKKDGLSGI